MKRITASALIAFASFAAAGSALAQDRAAQATVPFDFTVGNKLLPPGTYIITPQDYGVIMIQNPRRNITVLTTTTFDSREPRSGGKLVFNKYGDQYFLREVLCASASLSVDLPQSKQEKRVHLQEATVHDGSQVFIASK